MNVYERLRTINTEINLYHVNDEEFKQYGLIHQGYDVDSYIKEMTGRDIPQEGNVYVPSDPELEKLPITDSIREAIYGGIGIQVGYCNGNTHRMNAVEYHQGSEVNIAFTDLVLFLGQRSLINEDNTSYSTEDLKAFFVPSGSMIELYSTTLHFAPASVDKNGFKCLVILPHGTNSKWESGEFPYLFAKNKWLLIHEEHERMKANGALIGLYGSNKELIQVKE